MTVTVRPGPITAVAAAAKFASSRLPATACRARRPRAGCVARRRPRRPARCGGRCLVGGSSADRTLLASTCWVSRTPGAVALGLRYGVANTVATARREHLPARGASAAALRPSRALGRGRGIAGIEVVGQQRPQQRGHRDQRRRVGLVALRPASGSYPPSARPGSAIAGLGI